MNKIIIIVMLLSLFLYVSTAAFEVTLNEQKDYKYGWKISKARTFKYFNSTNEIGHSFLPMSPEDLPEAHGIWVIRHKDFLEIPEVFDESNRDTLGLRKASIEYSSRSLLFYSVKLKVLIYGDATIDVISNSGNSIAKSEIALSSDIYKQCVNKNSATNAIVNHSDNVLTWVTFEIQTPGTSKVKLQTTIEHSKSFVMFESIAVSYTGDAEEANDAKWKETGAFELETKGHAHVRCSIE